MGFTEFESNGHIDCFYVHHAFQNQGIGTLLMTTVEAKRRESNIRRIYAEVSITAKPFFLSQGFDIVKPQMVTIRGCELRNFVMEKHIK